jgi:tetratricopeptide (TPR) repeat protein
MKYFEWPTMFVMAAASLFFATFSSIAQAQDTVHDLQKEWAIANYQLEGDAQLDAFEALKEDALRFTTEHPEDADGWVWSGIIKSTYAGAKGGLGALKLAKSARKDLEKAIEIDGTAMNGSAYSTLGTLYFSVPGWPLGFGSDKKAGQMLRKGLELNPDGIDSNYFFAQFMRDQNNLAEARTYYLKARTAAPRPDRPLADQGRQLDIDTALATLDAE